MAIALCCQHALAASGDALLARCDQAWRPDVPDYAAALCYLDAASASGEWAAAAARVAERRKQAPGDDWLVLVAAFLAGDDAPVRAAAYYRDAIGRFVRTANRRGELIARGSYSLLLSSLGDHEGAASEVARVVEIGATTTDHELRLRARVVQARHLVDTGVDLDHAHRLLVAAQREVRRQDPYRLHVQIANDLAVLSHWLGRYDEARGQYSRLDRLAQQGADRETLAFARFGAANVAFEAALEMPRADARDRVLSLAHDAAAAARAAASPYLEFSAVHLLAELHLLPAPSTARGYVDRCFALAAQLATPAARAECHWLDARLRSSTDAVGAAAAIHESLQLLVATGDTQRLTYAWRHWLRLRTAESDYAGAERALDAFEGLRTLQREEGGRAAVLAAWSRDYYWLAGRLLQRSLDSASPENAQVLRDRAVDVMERLRARVLAERLLSTAGAGDDRQRRIMRARALVDPDRIDVTMTQGNTPTLAQVRAHLGSDEALLSYQMAPAVDVAGEFGGGSWVVVVTRTTEHVVALPDRVRVADLVALQSTDGQATAIATRARAALHDALLAEPLARLPKAIRRLVIVADEPLFRLPFATLGGKTGQPVLASRYSIAFAPSLTIWAHGRQAEQTHLAARTAVFAAPVHGGNNAVGGFRDVASGLGELPEARAEAAAIAARFGSRSEVRLGAAANEAAVRAQLSAPKRTGREPSATGVLHFAAHAVVDERAPERSAVVLSPQHGRDDGLLDAREIAALRWTDRLIVLSACSSATGNALRGEGVQSLARAFLAGGARTVIASLWRVRDDHARDFFAAFYEVLADGARADDALRAAQNALRDQGYPEAAWAAFQLYGDGRLRFAEPVPEPLPRRLLLAGVAAMGVLLLLWWIRRGIARRAEVR